MKLKINEFELDLPEIIQIREFFHNENNYEIEKQFNFWTCLEQKQKIIYLEEKYGINISKELKLNQQNNLQYLQFNQKNTSEDYYQEDNDHTNSHNIQEVVDDEQGQIIINVNSNQSDNNAPNDPNKIDIMNLIYLQQQLIEKDYQNVNDIKQIQSDDELEPPLKKLVKFN